MFDSFASDVSCELEPPIELEGLDPAEPAPKLGLDPAEPPPKLGLDPAEPPPKLGLDPDEPPPKLGPDPDEPPPMLGLDPDELPVIEFPFEPCPPPEGLELELLEPGLKPGWLLDSL